MTCAHQRPRNGRHHLWLATAALLLSGLVGAAGAVEDERHKNARRAFATLDIDGNGEVTYEEFSAKKILAFTGRDRNADNYLEPDEVQITPEQFSALDRNADGKISGVEFIDSPYGQFDTYDRDKSGTVTQQEFVDTLVGG